jgi:2-polyprenyl-6-hydroxyphenyl methylase/3-demethylubiquinone-9 3-methyltransferase
MSATNNIVGRKGFEFGANWHRFLSVLNTDRIRKAEMSLSEMLGTHSLDGKHFLDVGSGSGLFSLAAKRLGAKVRSFDCDPESVACTEELKRRYFPDDSSWTIGAGSVLDTRYLAGLGQFDIVYSWGVLHHTGNMFTAFDNVVQNVTHGGRLFIAIYNDQGWISKYWAFVKQSYNKSSFTRFVVIVIHAPYLLGLRYLVRVVTGRHSLERGMSLWHDMIDWLGGYPFEVAKPEVVICCFRDRGFTLEKLRTCGGRLGCNEFVFRRT